MAYPRVVYKITSYSKKGKYTKKGWGYINTTYDVLLLNDGKLPNGDPKFIAFDKCKERFSPISGTKDQYRGIYTDYPDTYVEVFDDKYRKKVSKGFEEVSGERNTYVWFKKMK